MPNEETAIAVAEPKPAKVPVPIRNGVMSPIDMDGLWRLAQIMASSGLMPKGVDRPEAVFVAVQMGMEVGLSPVQAVQNIAVINGRPAIWGDALLGLVQASGLLEEFAEFSEGTWPNDDYRAICVAKRKGRQTPIRAEFSREDAGKAGLLGKAGPWAGYPKRMMQMRARGFVLRDGFADVLKGLRTAEEVQDYDVDMIRTGNGSYAPSFGANNGDWGSQTLPAPAPPKEDNGDPQAAAPPNGDTPANGSGTPPSETAPNGNAAVNGSTGTETAPNGNQGTGESSTRIGGSTLPTRRRQNKFQVNPGQFNGQVLLNTAGVLPASLLQIRDLVRDPRARQAVQTFLRDRVGYDGLSFLREEEAQHLIQTLTPPAPGPETTPLADSQPEKQPPAPREDEHSTSTPDESAPTVHCPMDNKDHSIDGHCKGGGCATRNQFGWCGIIGEEPKEVF